jgi:hypothetical protein
MSKAAIGAWTILLACFAAWIGTFAIPSLHTWNGVVYVRHGLEGAFVGGLCDAFAIWRVYAEIESGYEPLSREVSRFVARDIVRADNLVAEIRTSLDAPATRAAVRTLLEDRFPKDRLMKLCLDFWQDDLKRVVTERAIRADLHALLSGPSEAGVILDDPDVRMVLRHCLSATIADTGRADRLHAMLELNWVIGKIFNADDLRERLADYAATLAEPPTPGPTVAGTLLREYLQGYVAAWASLPEAERRKASERVVEVVGPILVTKVAELIWDEREELVAFLGTGARLSAHPFVDALIGRLEPVMANVPTLIEDTLHAKLSSLGGKGVRALIEKNTRARLDMIQLNGTLLGLVVGLLVGLLSAGAKAAF